MAAPVVAIAGPADDFCRAVAVACAEAGAKVALATQDTSTGQEFAVQSIANELWVLDCEHLVRVLDATDAAAVTAFAEEVEERLGPCTALVAAHHHDSTLPADELSATTFADVFQANVTAPFLAAQAFARLMDRAGGGRIIFASSPGPGDAAYRAAHGAIEALATALAQEWSSCGVHVTTASRTDASSVAATATRPLPA